MPYDYETVDAKLEVRKVPDTLTPAQEASANPPELGAGFYLIGVNIEGVFVPIGQRKAGGLDADIERLKEAQAHEQPTQPTQPTQPRQENATARTEYRETQYQDYTQTQPTPPPFTSEQPTEQPPQ